MFGSPYATPGIGSQVETRTAEVTWGGSQREVLYGSSPIDGSTRSGTSVVLYPGMLLGKVAATGKLKQWDPEATDGTQQIAAILDTDQRMIAPDGSDIDVLIRTIRVAPLQAGALLIDDATMVGHAFEHLARKQLSELGCIFDDGVSGALASTGAILSANTTLDANDFNTSIVVTGARTITIPVAVAGVEFRVSASGGTTTFAGAVTTTVTNGKTAVLRGLVTGADTVAWFRQG